MTEDDTRALIAAMTGAIKTHRDKAKTPQEREFGALCMVAVELIGEMLIDIKRIANAAEQLTLDGE